MLGLGTRHDPFGPNDLNAGRPVPGPYGGRPG
jgi:hypothetical protein